MALPPHLVLSIIFFFKIRLLVYSNNLYKLFKFAFINIDIILSTLPHFMLLMTNNKNNIGVLHQHALFVHQPPAYVHVDMGTGRDLMPNYSTWTRC